MGRRLTYTVSEAAEILHIARSTACECVRRRELPALWFARRIVITRHGLGAIRGPLDDAEPVEHQA